MVTRAHRARRGGRGAAMKAGGDAGATGAALPIPPTASVGTPVASCLERYRGAL